MKKRIVAVLLLLVICFAIPVSAETDKELLVDQANLLTEAEADKLERELERISDRYDVDVVVLTVYSLGYQSSQAYADDFFDYKGYGRGSNRDGILLLVSTERNDWCISTSGSCQKDFDDNALDQIEDSILPNLRVGDFNEAFIAFVEECEQTLKFDFAKHILIAIVVGVVVALIVTGIFRSQLKSVKFQSGASNYVRPGSMNVTKSQDIFLYKNVSRRPKPQNNSSSGGHRSSSGRSHGGRSGKF